ncbi:MAG: DNA replication and repair protein RecF [Deltaproteobacteria bacterium]|nr:DNA replication and repair protein RecF [Deltaproteobacteria bacterium]
MVIQELGLSGFRNYQELFLPLGEGIHLFLGANGQGKTNLAEALHLITHLESFRSRRLEPLIRKGQDTARIKARFTRQGRPCLVEIEIARGGKKVWLDGQPVGKTSEYLPLFFSLLFNAEHLYFYRSFPAYRRAFFDRLISFHDRGYLESLKQLRVVLAQKNSLLRQGDLSSLADWNRLFMEKSQDITGRRELTVSQLRPEMEKSFQGITGREGRLTLTYRSSLPADPVGWPEFLQAAQEKESQAGYALYGPQRDDYRMTLTEGGATAKEGEFSQGEYRAALLALLLGANRLCQQLGARPVLILDDLFSELDAKVREHLAARLDELDNQVFITATQAPDFGRRGKRYGISGGTCQGE